MTVTHTHIEAAKAFLDNVEERMRRDVSAPATDINCLWHALRHIVWHLEAQGAVKKSGAATTPGAPANNVRTPPQEMKVSDGR